MAEAEKRIDESNIELSNSLKDPPPLLDEVITIDETLDLEEMLDIADGIGMDYPDEVDKPTMLRLFMEELSTE